jgi:hypothetical protein
MRSLRFDLMLIGCVVLIFFVPANAGAQTSQQVSMNISGTWTSEAGDFVFEQAGAAVNGVLDDTSGRTAWVDAEIRDDQRLYFIWGFDAEEMGEASLTMSDDGNFMAGPYADLLTGKLSVLVLARDFSVINVDGRWTSDFGFVEFDQAGAKVRGVLEYTGGITACVEGEFRDGDRLLFLWGFGQEEWGEAALTLSDGGSILSGPYADLNTGKLGTLVLIRGATDQ